MGSEVMDRASNASSYAEAGPGPSCDVNGAPESWEMVDLEASMNKLLAPSSNLDSYLGGIPRQVGSGQIHASDGAYAGKNSAVRYVDVEEVDSFLREALQGKDRLTILRLEKDVEKFMRNPRLQQFEFQPMPSSYLRLAAHRVVQHYNLQSLVADSSNPDSTRIIARKIPDSRFPKVRLADIPFNSLSEEQQVQTANQKYELKKRPNRNSKYGRDGSDSSDSSSKLNPTKSVEERKEEYNKARARIFNSSDFGGRVEDESISLDNCADLDLYSAGSLRYEKKIEQHLDTVNRAEFCNALPRVANVKPAEREASVNYKMNNRVAIFRDREKDKKDPDYDRSYDRYMQRFDPGFGVSQAPYGMQAMYTPVVNYNTEFPSLGGAVRPQMCLDPPLHGPVPHVRGPWAGTSNGVGYGHPDSMMNSFNSGHLGTHSASGVYMHPQQFARPAPTMTYVHSQERFPQPISQPHLQSEGSFSQARRQ